MFVFFTMSVHKEGDKERCPFVEEFGSRPRALCDTESQPSSGLDVRMHPRVFGRFAEVGMKVGREEKGFCVRVAPCMMVDSVLRLGGDLAFVRRGTWTREMRGAAVAMSGALGQGVTTGVRWEPGGTAAFSAARQSQRTSASVLVEDKKDGVTATLSAALRQQQRKGLWWALGAEGAWKWQQEKTTKLCEAAAVCAAGWRERSEAAVRLSAQKRMLDIAVAHKVSDRWQRGLTVGFRGQFSDGGWRAWAAAEKQIDEKTLLRGAIAHDGSVAVVSVAHRVSEFTELLFGWHLNGQGRSVATLTLVLTD